MKIMKTKVRKKQKPVLRIFRMESGYRYIKFRGGHKLTPSEK